MTICPIPEKINVEFPEGGSLQTMNSQSTWQCFLPYKWYFEIAVSLTNSQGLGLTSSNLQLGHVGNSVNQGGSAHNGDVEVEQRVPAQRPAEVGPSSHAHQFEGGRPATQACSPFVSHHQFP